MVIVEQFDFVHIYYTNHMYNKIQEIDFFGELTRISFSRDTESNFISVVEVCYGFLIEYK